MTENLFGSSFILHFKVRVFFGRKLQLSYDNSKVNRVKRIALVYNPTRFST